MGMRLRHQDPVMPGTMGVPVATTSHAAGLARTLRTRRSDLISLIVPDVANHYYAALARGVHDAIKPRNLHVILGNTDAIAQEERYFLRAIAAQRAAGAIVVPFQMPRNDIG